MSTPKSAAVRALEGDATNRAVRSLLTGLGLDVAVGIAVVMASTFGIAQSWDDIQWKLLGFLVLKSIVQAICAFILRRFVDGSKIPTPLPPELVPGPNGDDPEAPADDTGRAG